MERKIIFKARVGSHLHGTNTPDSDEDYLGVFLPSTEDLLSLQSRPKEMTDNIKVSDGPRNKDGDVDCKYLALYTFLKEAAQGQSQALELLFIPEEHIIIKTQEWDKILKNKHILLSRQGITPFIGFAKAQAAKAIVKGENLRVIQSLIKTITNNKSINVHKTLEYYVTPEKDTYKLFGEILKRETAKDGIDFLKISGRGYNLGLTVKRFFNSLQILEQKYGTRVRAAAEDVYDFKSVTHCFRLLSEAEEHLSTGSITFPRPDGQELIKIKKKQYNGDLDVDIEQKIDYIRQMVEPKSNLPPKPNYKKIDDLCQTMLLDHIKYYWMKQWE